MSRDFLIKFKNDSDALNAENLLNSFTSNDNIKVFEADNRGSSLFVELVYPNDIMIMMLFIQKSYLKLEKFKLI